MSLVLFSAHPFVNGARQNLLPSSDPLPDSPIKPNTPLTFRSLRVLRPERLKYPADTLSKEHHNLSTHSQNLRPLFCHQRAIKPPFCTSTHHLTPSSRFPQVTESLRSALPHPHRPSPPALCSLCSTAVSSRRLRRDRKGTRRYWDTVVSGTVLFTVLAPGRGPWSLITPRSASSGGKGSTAHLWLTLRDVSETFTPKANLA